jgi:CheY-like chemotaxis protein
MGYAARVLVVDDQPIVAESCTRILRRQGFGVDTASSAREGLALTQEGNFDAVLLDLRMPDLNGLEILRQVKQTTPEAKIIIITGYPSVDSAVEALKLGASDYLVKPFTPLELSETVRRVLQEPQPHVAQVVPLSLPSMPKGILSLDHGRSVRTVTRSGKRVAILGLNGIFGSSSTVFEGVIDFLKTSRAPIIAEYGSREITPVGLLRYIQENDRVVLVAPIEMGKAPGVIATFYRNGRHPEEEFTALSLPEIGFPQVAEWIEAIGVKCDFAIVGVEPGPDSEVFSPDEDLEQRLLEKIRSLTA